MIGVNPLIINNIRLILLIIVGGLAIITLFIWPSWSGIMSHLFNNTHNTPPPWGAVHV